MKHALRACALSAALALSSGSASAVVYDTFGTLAGATFGGTGIPNDAVAIGDYSAPNIPLPLGGSVAGPSFTLGLTAFARFGMPPGVTNDGAGTFFAAPGSADPDGPGPIASGALWNFGYYLRAITPNALATAALAGYSARLLYDVDPGPGTDFGTLTVPTLVGLPALPGQTLQDSQNLAFGFLYTAVPGLVAPPAGSFDPNAPGLYTFRLDLLQGASVRESVSIDVRVPEPATLPLIALAMLVLGVMTGRQRRV